MNEAYVISRLSHYIATIEFFHPQSNSLPEDIEELANAISHAGNDPQCRVIVLRSGGEVVCAGASLMNSPLSMIKKKD